MNSDVWIAIIQGLSTVAGSVIVALSTIGAMVLTNYLNRIKEEKQREREHEQKLVDKDFNDKKNINLFQASLIRFLESRRIHLSSLTNTMSGLPLRRFNSHPEYRNIQKELADLAFEIYSIQSIIHPSCIQAFKQYSYDVLDDSKTRRMIAYGNLQSLSNYDLKDRWVFTVPSEQSEQNQQSHHEEPESDQ